MSEQEQRLQDRFENNLRLLIIVSIFFVTLIKFSNSNLPFNFVMLIPIEFVAIYVMYSLWRWNLANRDYVFLNYVMLICISSITILATLVLSDNYSFFKTIFFGILIFLPLQSSECP